MSGISTHVLDTASGKPAEHIGVALYRGDVLLSRQTTNRDGRCPALLPLAHELMTGEYRIVFTVNGPFFPEVSITFRVQDPASHHHVPLLLSPYGYSVYRGS